MKKCKHCSGKGYKVEVLVTENGFSRKYTACTQCNKFKVKKGASCISKN